MRIPHPLSCGFYGDALVKTPMRKKQLHPAFYVGRWPRTLPSDPLLNVEMFSALNGHPTTKNQLKS